MSKSGQPATKADTGGQRVPKSNGDGSGGKKQGPRKEMPARKEAGKKLGA